MDSRHSIVHRTRAKYDRPRIACAAAVTANVSSVGATFTSVSSGRAPRDIQGTPKMRYKLLTIAAAALLLAACETTPRESADASAGANAGASGQSGGQFGSAAPGTQEELRQTIGDRVFFDYDSYSVRGDQRRTVEQVAQWMNEHQNVQLTIEGHADERGTREYNLALGDRRASSVRDVLVSQGVSQSRLNTISYGKERPEVTGSNEYAWEQNRRAVFSVR